MHSSIHTLPKTRFFGLGLRVCRRQYEPNFNHCDKIAPPPRYMPPTFGEVTQLTVLTPFKVIKVHRFCYQSKAPMRLSTSDQY